MKNAIRKFLEHNKSGHWAARSHTLSKPGEKKSPDSKQSPRIAVVGDTMTDMYFYVTANRISPEFPIPVMNTNMKGSKIYPGGAANVAYQFKHWNIDAGLFGPNVGMQRTFRENGMNKIEFGPNKVFPNDHSGPTMPYKRRYYDKEKDFPLCRMDEEYPNYQLNDEDLKLYQEKTFEALKDFKPYVTIYSDYDKGMFSGIDQVIDDLDPSLSIVDPKKGPISKWRGCTIIKPNAKEAAELSGETGWHEQADYFYDQTDCSAVVITQGGSGVVGKIGYDGYFSYSPKKQVVADSVIGAGDCFVAFLAMCMSHQMDLLEAIKVSFEAGAVYVQRRHNKPVSPFEVRKHTDPIEAKFVEAEDLNDRDFSLAFTNGCFDVLHPGHIQTLEFAKYETKADKLVVAVNSDTSVQAIKGGDRPILSLEQRMRMLASLECVDFVIAFSENTPYNLIQEVKPDVLVKGGEYKDDENVVGSDIVSNVLFAPMADGLSTSQIINKIKGE